MQVEMLSHYGSEHYCPLSLLRVLGATMMEVYEYTEEQQGSQQPPGGSSVVLPASEGELIGDGECVCMGRGGRL